MQARTTRASLLVLAATLTSVACQELQVENPNDPDRDRAIGRASDVENLVAGTFATLWNPLHDLANAALLWSAWGEEATTTSQVGGLWLAATQFPVEPLINRSSAVTATDPTGPITGWLDFHRVVSNANDGLAAIRNERMLMGDEGDTEAARASLTARAEAVALLNRGMAWGNLALGWDQATVLTEDSDLGADASAVVMENIRPYPEVLDAAVSSLAEAATVAGASNFSVPIGWYKTADAVTSGDLVRIANSLQAKYMVYAARSPEERANSVDWNEVLRLTAAGVTTTFAPMPSPEAGGLVSDYIRQLQLNSRNGLQNARADYETLGPADVSGSWQQYLNTPLHQRVKFTITTPDRRVTGPTPGSNGAYFRFIPGTDDNLFGFVPGRGLFNFSYYQFWKYQGAFTNIAVPFMSVEENRLLRAEALLRTGDLEGAADLINVTRTRQQRIGSTTYPGLPPVTAAGVPESPDCVPQTRAGACGSLMDALVYERRIELYGVDGMRAYADARGFGLLPAGTPIHMPVPARELEALGLAVYTYGGTNGGNCGAGNACAPRLVNP